MRLQQTVKSNRTLLVDGPASVRLASGKAEVFGYQVKVSSKVVVREGKRLPFHVLENATFDVALGASGSVQEAQGSTIPASWSKPLEVIKAVEHRPVVVMVVGQADSGKSSLCTYLVNRLVEGKFRVAVLDGDLGQSDIGPSATFAYGQTMKPVADLYNLKLENAFFVGVTSPISALDKAVEGLAALKADALQRQVDYVLVNTDGWVACDTAVQYKTQLVQQLKPDVLVAVQVGDELTPLVANLENSVPLVTVEPSAALSPRTPEKRKLNREMTYAKYMKNSKLQCLPISQLIVEPRNGVPKTVNPEAGVLVGLCGSKGKYLGIGVLREINPVRRVLKVQTAITAIPIRIIIGKVLVNEKLQEVGETPKE
jgi:polynucleotide 5'-hydroxyl-kinase GRC3/NOL9